MISEGKLWSQYFFPTDHDITAFKATIKEYNGTLECTDTSSVGRPQYQWYKGDVCLRTETKRVLQETPESSKEDEGYICQVKHGVIRCLKVRSEPEFVYSKLIWYCNLHD